MKYIYTNKSNVFKIYLSKIIDIHLLLKCPIKRNIYVVLAVT